MEEQQLNQHNQEILEHLVLEIQEELEEIVLLDLVEEVEEQVQQDLKVLVQVELEELVEQEKIYLQFLVQELMQVVEEVEQ
jgi:hypothetical protein